MVVVLFSSPDLQWTFLPSLSSMLAVFILDLLVQCEAYWFNVITVVYVCGAEGGSNLEEGHV